jgi:hypothetical protein
VVKECEGDLPTLWIWTPSIRSIYRFLNPSAEWLQLMNNNHHNYRPKKFAVVLSKWEAMSKRTFRVAFETFATFQSFAIDGKKRDRRANAFEGVLKGERVRRD